MIVRTKILFTILGLVLFITSCQTTKNKPQKEELTSFLSQDKLGNIYQISGMKITKFSPELDTIQTNSIFSNGTISSLDTRNPMQLVLFYRQQQKIVLMDNTLSETNTLKLGFEDWIDLACLSNRDNSFWLYTINTQSLIKIDKKGKVTSKFENMAQLLQRDINPTQLIEYNNQVYLFDPNQGLFVFDLFGNYIKRIQLENAQNVKFYQNKVFFRVKNDVFNYNLVSFDKKQEFQSTENFDDFELGRSGVLVLKNSKIIR